MIKETLIDLDAILISNPVNIYYLTGFAGLAENERESFVLLTKDKSYLLTYPMYLEQARSVKQLQPFHVRVEVIEISKDHPLTKQIEKLFHLRSFTHKIRMGFEADDLRVSELNQLSESLPKFEFLPTHNRIEKMRIRKSKEEIAYLKKAGELSDACYDDIISFIKPGITELELAWEIETFFRKNNAKSSFSPIVAFGPNTALPHHHTSDIKLKEHDLILIDFGAKVSRYCADMTRIVAIGNQAQEIFKIHKTVFDAYKVAIELLEKGERSTVKLDLAARAVIEKAGYPTYPHSLGHGIGLDIHEAPRLTRVFDTKLETGMAVTVEPGVYLNNQFGIRIEDTVLITDTGIEYITKANKELLML